MTHSRWLVLGACAALAAPPIHAQRLEQPLLHLAAPARSAPRFAPAPAVAPAPRGATRRLVALQMVGATLGAIAAGAAGYTIARDPNGDRVKGDAGYNRRGNVGFAIGSFVGATVLGYGIGRADGSHGSLLMTAMGAAIPAAPIAAASNDPYAYYLAVLLLVPGEGIGATIGYQSSRRAPAP